ncbi:hypothetical protein Thiowin_04286 [Thiorhodovibrio winogradskyi]|uniref:DUF4214 domain-containing protein n=1 Tax=Thiorhodovibrio winogradskyi TaxID=77007 RepID=A0ABZ0SF90_9GAMM|nr:DUF4214 domain-containing protein [Thiorhodovibrio winogradskyi]
MIGSYLVEVGTHGADSFNAEDDSIYFGSAGADWFLNDNANNAYFVGGSGGDYYAARPGSITIIQDAGNSPDDVFYEITGAMTEPYLGFLVDERHFGIFNLSLTSGVLFLDWKDPANRIETMSTSLGTFSYEEYRQIIESSPEALGHLSSEALFGDPQYLDSMILQAGAWAAHYEVYPGVEITRSEATTVALLYSAGLGRDPDVHGLNFWIDQRANGMSLELIAGAFLDSPEFTNRYGDDDVMSAQRFLGVMYENVLGRLPDTAGFAYWEDAMAQRGLAREEVLMFFADSTENRSQAAYVDTLYQVGDDWFF